MSVICRLVLILFLTTSMATRATAQGAVIDDLSMVVNEPSCNASGECTLDVGNDVPALIEMCNAPRASLIWNKYRKGALLITCDCECTAHENAGWLVMAGEKNSPGKIQRYILGKMSTVSALLEKPAYIPDVIASHPVCEDIDVRKVQVSVFVSLAKAPTGNESVPYCFYPIYFVESDGGIAVMTDNPLDEFGKLLVDDSGQSEEQELILEISQWFFKRY